MADIPTTPTPTVPSTPPAPVTPTPPSGSVAPATTDSKGNPLSGATIVGTTPTNNGGNTAMVSYTPNSTPAPSTQSSSAPYGVNPQTGVPYGGQNSNDANPDTSVYNTQQTGPATAGSPTYYTSSGQGYQVGANGQVTYVNGTQGSTSSGNPNVDALNASYAKQAQAATTFANAVSSIQNGSTPLNAGEQAQINGLEQQFQQLINTQGLVNTNNTNTAQIRGFQTGVAEFDRGFQAQTIGSIITAGANKIASLQTQEASAVASLTQSLQNNDIANLKTAYDAYDAAQTDVQNGLKAVIADTQQAMKDAAVQQVMASGVTNPKDILAALQANGHTDISSSDIASTISNLSPDAANILQVAQTAQKNGASPDVVKAIMASKTIADALVAAGNSASLPDINSVLKTAVGNNAPQSVIDAIKNSTSLSDALSAAGQYTSTLTGDMGQYLQYTQDATKAGQVPESYTTWENAQTYNKAYATAAGTAAGKNAGTPSGFSGATSPVTSPLGLVYNPPASIAPYVAFASNGVKYVDMSAFKGTPTEANAAVADAQAAGYKVITNKNIALDIQNIADATSKLQTIKSAFDGITTDSAAARDSYYSAAITMAKELQTNPDAAASGVFQDAALDVLKAISGTQGFRGGASMVQAVQSTFPSNTDTKAVADQKIANISKLMTDREQALVGTPSASDKLLIDGTKASGAVDTYIQNNAKGTNSITGKSVSDAINTLTGLNMSDSDIIAYIQDPSHGFPNYGDLVNWNQ